MNIRILSALLVLAISGSLRCDLVPELVPIGMQTLPNEIITSVNWCTCQFLAAGGFSGTFPNKDGVLSVYQLNQTTGNLSLVGTPTTLGIEVDSVAWCPSCKFLAAGGSDSDFNGIIQLYSFNPSHPGSLELVGTPTTLGIDGFGVFALDWCPSCSFLVAAACGCPPFAGFVIGCTSSSIIQVYRFDPSHPGNLVTVDGSITINGADIFAVKWCHDCNYLLAVSDNFVGGNDLYVYNFDSHSSPALVLSTSAQSNAVYYSVDSCDDCHYIAAGGQRSGVGVIDIYRFDSPQSLTLITTSTISIPNFTVASLEWCQDCDNLAVTAANFNDGSDAIVQLYHFDASETLSLAQTYSLNFPFTYLTNNLDWCGNCCDLAVGGGSAFLFPGFIQLFKGNTCLPAPTNLTAQKISHRFPTQVDIINKLCWDTVAGAVSYNVYADAALTILLASITNPPLCYSQHQICTGKSVTYYVTAVDAQGTQSEPAVVTI